jgi:hypothetical protein
MKATRSNDEIYLSEYTYSLSSPSMSALACSQYLSLDYFGL